MDLKKTELKRDNRPGWQEVDSLLVGIRDVHQKDLRAFKFPYLS